PPARPPWRRDRSSRLHPPRCHRDPANDRARERRPRLPLPSERHRLGEKAKALRSTRERSTELDRVDGDRVAQIAGGVGAACWPCERQRERLTVAPCPLRDDIGNYAAVVLGRQRDLATGCVRDVDAMHPRVAREDDVEQVAHPPRLRLLPYLLLHGHLAKEPR